MNLDAKMMVPISEANSNFSRVMHMADNYGRVVILKDNKPKYLLIDLDQESLIYDLTDDVERQNILPGHSQGHVREYIYAVVESAESRGCPLGIYRS